MGQYLILTPADRDRLGVTVERLAFDPTGVTNREAVLLADYGKWHTPRLWYRALNLRPVYLNDDGTSRVVGEGEEAPEGEPYDLLADSLAWTFAVWMTLRRNGIETRLEELEFDLYGLRIIRDEDETPTPKGDVEVETTDPKTSTGT